MAETYEQIIDEIENTTLQRYFTIHDLFADDLTTYEEDFRIVAKHIAARVREAVGGNPDEWWVADADGNHVHIGDEVTNSYNCTFCVFGLGVRNGKHTVEYDDGCDDANTVHKVIPDTREKIIADAIRKFADGANPNCVIADAVDRAMKLAEVEDA